MPSAPPTAEPTPQAGKKPTAVKRKAPEADGYELLIKVAPKRQCKGPGYTIKLNFPTIADGGAERGAKKALAAFAAEI